MSSAARLHYGWIILPVATLVVSAALGLARFGYAAVLPAMQEALRFDNTAGGALATVNLTGYLLSAVVSGALASRFGPRRVIASGLALASVGMLLTGWAYTFRDAAVWRFVTGIGSGASNVPVMALISAWFARRRRGFASGIGVAGSSVALVVAGPAVPFILSSAGANGWRICWWLFGAVGLAVAVLATVALRDSPSHMGLAAVGASPDESGSAPASTPARWASVYRSGRVWHLGAVYLAFGFAYIVYMTFFVKRLIADAGYSRVEAGHLFMLMGWVSLPCGLIWGGLSDVLGRRAALVLVFLVQGAAIGLFALWRVPAGFLTSAVLFGLTAWSIPAIMAAVCGDVVGPRLAPAALGFITLFFGIGQAASPSIAGALADRLGSFSAAFALASAVSLLGALGAAALPPTCADGK